MYCNHKVSETLLGVIILIFAIFPALLGNDLSNWIIIIAAIALIIHAWICSHSRSHASYEETKPKKRRR